MTLPHRRLTRAGTRPPWLSLGWMDLPSRISWDTSLGILQVYGLLISGIVPGRNFSAFEMLPTTAVACLAPLRMYTWMRSQLRQANKIGQV